MQTAEAIETRRQAILREMGQIRHVVRGTFQEQLLPVRHRGQEKPVLRGPYFLLAKWEGGKTRSRRVKAEEASLVKEGAENYKRLKALCEEFAALTERLGEQERQAEGADGGLKKGRKSRSSRGPK